MKNKLTLPTVANGLGALTVAVNTVAVAKDVTAKEIETEPVIVITVSTSVASAIDEVYTVVQSEIVDIAASRDRIQDRRGNPEDSP